MIGSDWHGHCLVLPVEGPSLLLVKYVCGILSYLARWNEGRFPFITARIARCGWILLDPRYGGAIDQTRPFLPGEIPQSLRSIYDVRAGVDEHDDGDDRTAMAMAMECWPRRSEFQYNRGSIRVGRKILWIVARKKRPRASAKHMERAAIAHFWRPKPLHMPSLILCAPPHGSRSFDRFERRLCCDVAFLSYPRVTNQTTPVASTTKPVLRRGLSASIL
jgi:hypothetical protein